MILCWAAIVAACALIVSASARLSAPAIYWIPSPCWILQPVKYTLTTGAAGAGCRLGAAARSAPITGLLLLLLVFIEKRIYSGRQLFLPFAFLQIMQAQAQGPRLGVVAAVKHYFKGLPIGLSPFVEV